MASVSVCVVSLKGAYLSAVYGIKEILEYADWVPGFGFDVTVLSGDEFASARKRFDLVIIPPFRMRSKGPARSLDSAVVGSLKRAIARGSLPVSVCAGAYYLCATGVAEGNEVTTHWSLADDLAGSYPSVTVRKERVLIDAGSYIAAGGITSFQDLSLYLIRRYLSREDATEVARMFLINPGDRNQLQYMRDGIDDPTGGDVVSRAKAFMNGRLGESLSLAQVASHCGVTIRTLLRRFAESGGGTPSVYLQTARIAHARALLESSDEPVKTIAGLSGYQDLPSFIRAFRKRAGASPGEYRKAFRPS
jgi:transcriptional regulator GlxA family with amidase domain